MARVVVPLAGQQMAAGWVHGNRTRSAETEKRALSDLLADARNTAKALRD
jgi:hypothetical protein